MKRPKSVKDYIAHAPSSVKPKLKQLRKLIKENAPSSIEKISYGMPYYGYKGRVAYFAYAKKHIGLYIMPHILIKYPQDISEYKKGKATLQFALDKPIPSSLVKKLIKSSIEYNKKKSK